MSPQLVFATLAIATTVVYSIPQVVKIYISNTPKAISGVSSVAMLFASVSWLASGFLEGDRPLTVANAFLSVFNALILLLIFQKVGVHRIRTLLVTVLLAGILVAVRFYLPQNGLGLFAASLTAVMLIPQGFKIIRLKQSSGVSGVSYLMLAISSLCWVAYGHLTGNMVLVLPNLVLFPTALLVYFMVIKYRTSNFWYLKATTGN
ncbi:MAG TPA: SemiSWEET family transporter [Bacteroidia bacterium]|nr:SemiSWEET family transporter [Bacteroidia bacterium]